MQVGIVKHSPKIRACEEKATTTLHDDNTHLAVPIHATYSDLDFSCSSIDLYTGLMI